jgi:hypothetical protein
MGRTKALASLVSEIEQTAYQRGYADGLRAAASAIKKLRHPHQNGTVTDEPATEEASPLALDSPSPKPKLRENSDQFRVLQAIRNQAGMRGIEIVRAITAAGHNIHERTVRTALSRLKGAYIEQREDRWYEIETGQSH